MLNRIAPGAEVLLLALVSGLGAGGFAAFAAPGFPLDDAWIHLQLARNLSAGNGFGLNAGESVSLSTAPLWTLIVALLYVLPWEIIASIKTVGALLLFGNALLARSLALQLGLGRDWGFLAGLVVGLTPRFLWASQSGMEVLLYAFLASGGLALHLQTFTRAPSLWGTVLLALAVLARPEAAILFPLAFLDRWRANRRFGEVLVLYRWHALLFVALLVPWALFNSSYGSGVLPNTYYAKVGSYGLPGALADGAWQRVGATLLFYPLVQVQELIRFSIENNVVLTLAVPLGLLVILKKGREGSWIFVLVLIGFPILRGILAPFKGATFQQGRYAAYLIPLLTVAGLVGLKEAWAFLRSGLDFPLERRLRNWLSRLVWILVLGNLLVLDLRDGRNYGENVADINQMHVAMGRWLAANTPTNAVVATNDIGAIAYFSHRRVIDIVGLATPEILGHLQPGVSADIGVLQYLEKVQPDYLVLLPNWYPQLAEMSYLFRPVHSIEVGPETIAGGTSLVAYRTVWAKD